MLAMAHTATSFPNAFLEFEQHVMGLFKNKSLEYNFTLPQKFVAICLYNPYWNDFRILNYFQKRHMATTLSELQYFRQLYGLDDPEAICKKLIRLVLDQKIVLNNHQISFIEKIIPEFRDRDMQAAQPGKLLVYECLLGRGFKGIGRVYTHIFVDMCTGEIFGKLSRTRSSDISFAVLKSLIIPRYQSSGYSVGVVLHARHAVCEMQTSLNELISRADAELNVRWKSTSRSFGVIERVQKQILTSSFFNYSGESDVTVEILENKFNHWLSRYNKNRLSCHRTVLF